MSIKYIIVLAGRVILHTICKWNKAEGASVCYNFNGSQLTCSNRVVLYNIFIELSGT